MPPRCSVTIKDNHEDHEDQDYNNRDDISYNVTLQVLVINNSNQHVNFPKIGHLEPPIDELTQIPINSATTQQMLPKTVKPNTSLMQLSNSN